MHNEKYLQMVVGAELESCDLGPTGIVSGEPRPRVAKISHTAASGVTVTTGVFALEPGVIRAEVAATETIQVLEGEILVEFESGESLDLKPGDVVVFPAGTATTRTVKSPYKEFYVHSSAS